MEPDSTTIDNNSKAEDEDSYLPFPVYSDNLKLYKELTFNNEEMRLECQIIERLQAFGLIPKSIKCPTGEPGCLVISRPARVIDRLQWVCEGCGKRQPIRAGSFFLRLQCSILQALQIILAWCEDAECEAAALCFGVKPRVASTIYDKLDDIAAKEHSKCLLGGDNSVVLVEMYPDCLNRLSPDTTDQPHVHRVLMLADTNHVPTKYQLHVIKDNSKKQFDTSLDNQSLRSEVEDVISLVTSPNSTLVTGSNVPSIDGTSTTHQLLQYCDVDMQHFLTTRIWRQALALCAASRDLCAGAAGAGCARGVQRYLHSALYRLSREPLYPRVLRALAQQYTTCCDGAHTVNCRENAEE